MTPRIATAVGLFTVLTSLVAVTAEAGDAGLIEHYPFDSKACYQPLTPAGKGVQCVSVDGRKGVRLGGQSYLETDGAAFDHASLSISLWFYMDRTSKDEMRLLVRDEGELLQRIFQLQIYNPTQGYGDAHVRFLAETDAGGGWEVAAVTESSGILPGSWTHLVVTVKAQDEYTPGVVRIWLNGRQERVLAEANLFATKRSLSKAMQKTSKSGPSPYQLSFDGGLATNPGIPLTIGTSEAERYTFDGVIADVRLYRHALSREEVRNLYRQ